MILYPMSLKKPAIYTIGHSTRSIDEFIRLLKVHGIKEIVDVRTIPGSRFNPQFNEARLKRSLKSAGIGYKHLKKLGGRRRARKNSPNVGWRNASFRGYADHMATAGFSTGLAALIKLAGKKKTAIMCAEAVPWRCHRSLIGDALIKKGWIVWDIISGTSVRKHKPTQFLKVRKGQLIYPEPKDQTSAF